jgi:selenocysteine lyase/cysteine desulfurase
MDPMNRRSFLASGAGGVLGVSLAPQAVAAGDDADVAGIAGESGGHSVSPASSQVRDLFPRAQAEVFLNAAGGTPLSTFAERGLRGYEDFWRLGPADGRGAAFGARLDETRAGIAALLGAHPEEIALVQCTKHGEQIVLDGLPSLREGGNVVTNDLHFSGSLHNLIGLRRAGLDVRIVRSRDWRTDLDAMADAIDDATALVSVTLVSNVNGHIEPIREIAELAHARGAWVYADIIQAAGIVPLDMAAMGIDFAAGNGYKWLFGPHGTGFLYVRRELQGTALQDRLFPGHVGYNYPPWTDTPDAGEPDFIYTPPDDAQRYQPGHLAYLCYAALHEGLGFIDATGVERARQHSVALNQRLLAGLDEVRYECISPHVDRSPIIAFRGPEGDGMLQALQGSNVVVSYSSGGQVRVSPAIYNDEADIDALIEVLQQV